MRKLTIPWCLGGLILGVTLLCAGLVPAPGGLWPAKVSAAQFSQEFSAPENSGRPLLVAQNTAPQEPKKALEQMKAPPPPPAIAPKSAPRPRPEMERSMERRAPVGVGDLPAKPGTRKFGAQPIRAKETPGD